MRLKFILIIFLFISTVLSISVVSASDMNLSVTDLDDSNCLDYVVENEVNDVGSNLKNNEINCLASNEYFNDESNSNLKDSMNKTFQDIQTLIDNADEGSTIELSGNYIGNGTRINVNKTLTINGKNATLDGKNSTQIFIVNSNNVKINNLKFINGNTYSVGGAISWWGVNGSVVGCSFVNCRSNSMAGAIYWGSDADIGSVVGCSFVNCSSSSDGGVIYWGSDADIGSVVGCSFVNCYSFKGGAIYWNNGDGSVVGCSFVNCSAGYYGGAIFWNGVNGSVVGCSFVNCNAYSFADAIYWALFGGSVSYCIFDNKCVSRVMVYDNSNTLVADYNYWGMNYRNKSDFIYSGLYSNTNGNISPNNWILMSISSEEFIVSKPCIFTVKLDKLCDGENMQNFSGKLPDYTTKILLNNSELFNVDINESVGLFNITVNEAGDYVVSAVSPITSNVEAIQNFTAKSKDVPIDVTLNNISYGDNITGVINVSLTGNVSVLVGDTVYEGIVVDGEFSIDASNLTAGNYSNIPMSVASDDGRYVANADINIEINKRAVIITVANVSGKTTQNIIVLVNVMGDNGKSLDGITLNYTVSNSNVTKRVKVVNGIAKIALNFIVAGNYAVNVSFEGNGNYTNASAKSVINVVKTATTFVSPSSGAVYNGNYYSVILKDANGDVLASKEVQIKLLGKVYNVTTNAKGVAKVKVAATNVQVGNSYKVIYKFAGDSTYSGVSGSSTIKVVKTPTVITKVTTGAVKNYGYFYVKLTTNAGKVLANKVITMKSANNGKTYKLKTNANGVAKTDLWVKVKPLGKYYSYTFKYAGSAYYKPYTVTFKVKIVK